MKYCLIIFSLVGTAGMAGAFLGYEHVRAFLKTAQKSEGMVVELSRHSSGASIKSSGNYFYPVVKFKTLGGKEIEFVSSAGANPAEYEVGDKVSVFYDPLRPHQAKINSFLDVWLFPVISLFLGIIFGGIALVLYFLFWKHLN